MTGNGEAFDLSIIVPTRNRPHVFARLLDSIWLQRDVRIEVIVVDDGSTPSLSCDDLPQPAGSGSLGIVRLDQPRGACFARNRGIEASSSPLLLFLDDDVELVGQDLLSQLQAFADEHADVGVVALAELAPDGTWGFNLGPEGPPLEVARFLGCGALIRRRVLKDTGGFFEPLGYYYEEFELSMRIIDKGWRLVFHPAFRIVHHRDPSGRDGRRIRRLIARNAMLTALARFPLWMIAPATIAQMAKFTARSFAARPRDWVGPALMLWSTIWSSRSALRERVPVRSSSLRTYKRLARQRATFDSGTLPT